MKKSLFGTRVVFKDLLARSRRALVRAAQRNLIFTVSGQPGQDPILLINGRSFVDIEALPRLTNDSLGFQGNQSTLAVHASAPSTPTPTVSPRTPSRSEFTRGFLKAGIEEMSVIREWLSALINAVQEGHAVTDDFVSRYREEADESSVSFPGSFNRL